MRFAICLLLAGCTSPNEPPGGEFLGTWSFASGTNSVACPTGTTEQPVTGKITIKRALDADLVVLDDEGCNFTYMLRGLTATTHDKSCDRPAPELGAGVTAATTFSFITLDVSDGRNMNDTFGGQVAFKSSAGKLDCTFSGTAKLTKVSGE